MKTQRNYRPVSRRPPEKSRFTKHLAEFWHDLQDEQHWKYESSSPVQILEQLDLDTWQQSDDELVRAQWFWNRRPRLLRVTSCVVWLLAALGLPFWLFVIPAIGIPLLIISAAAVVNDILECNALPPHDYLPFARPVIHTLIDTRDRGLSVVFAS